MIIALSLTGCAEDNIKPSEDSRLASEVFGIIDLLKDAYERKDEDVIMTHTDADIAADIINGLVFSTAELEFTPRMVRITDSEVKVNLNWKCSWVLSDKQALENRGVSDLVFQRETMKLTYIDGNSPFSIPSVK